MITLLVCLTANSAWAGETVTVVSWGGAYEAAQRHALFTPYTEATGVDVDVATYDGTIQGLKTRANTESWDVIDMVEDQAIAACEAGLLHRLDHAQLLQPDGTISIEADFAPAVMRGCSIPQNVYATVIAYNDHTFPGIKPSRVEDFFDLSRFPGKRAIQKSPDGILEWALMAEGVPPSQVYDLLSTDRGLRLAFQKLDEIRNSIIWWDDVATPAELLRDKQVAMASGFNGRFFSIAHDEGAPVTIVWDGRLIGYAVWAIPISTDDDRVAKAFLRFAVAPERMARLAEHIPYGPARRSGLKRVGLHPEMSVPMRDHLPNSPQHGDRTLIRDSEWYAHTQTLRKRRFDTWLAQKEGEYQPGG